MIRVIKLRRMGESRDVYRVLMRKTEGKRTLGRSRRGLENNIEMGLQEVERGRMDWIYQAQESGGGHL